MSFLKNVPRRAISCVTRLPSLPLQPSEGAQDGAREGKPWPGDSRDVCLHWPCRGFGSVGQSSTCVWKFDLTRAAPGQEVSFSAMDGAFVFPGATCLLGPPGSVPGALDLRLLLDLLVPCQPCLLQTRQPGPCLPPGLWPSQCRAAATRDSAAEHTSRRTGNARNSYFRCFFFPFQLFRGRGVRGGEGPPKKPHTETQSSGESCICGKSKRGQVQVRVTKGSLSPKAVAAAVWFVCTEATKLVWPKHSVKESVVQSNSAPGSGTLLFDKIYGGKNNNRTLSGEDKQLFPK